LPECRELVVAIDGPAGAGKSTIAKELARELDYVYVDTGAMYRAVGFLAGEAGIALDDGERLGPLVDALDFQFPWDGPVQRCVVSGRDLTHAIRTPAISQAASFVSKNASVRAALVRRQRALASRGGAVMEGRDIGTVVLPEADLKVFLTASPRVRGQRRWLQLREQGVEEELDRVIADIEARDHQDATRAVSPLKKADDAIVLDTSSLGIERVRSTILRLVRARKDGSHFEIPDDLL
jgi:cytidylate kinase